MKITEKLARHPEKAFNIVDDAQARVILVEVGLFDVLRRSIDPALAAGHRVLFIFQNDHETHWIVGVYHAILPEVADHGYGALLIPKSQVSARELEEQVRASLDTDPDHPMVMIRTPLADPGEN
jgi:hypothetical protein